MKGTFVIETLAQNIIENTYFKNSTREEIQKQKILSANLNLIRTINSEKSDNLFHRHFFVVLRRDRERFLYITLLESA